MGNVDNNTLRKLYFAIGNNVVTIIKNVYVSIAKDK